MWTIERIKAELPDVKVKVGKSTLPGQVGGRLNPFAGVVVRQGKNLPTLTLTYAWATIAHALNTNTALHI